MNARTLAPAWIKAGTGLFWVISGLTLFWMLGKSNVVLRQRLASPQVRAGTTLDFDVFVQAAEMFRSGQVACLYDRLCLDAAQKVAGFSTGLMSWNYPPVVSHLLAPFAAFEPRTLYFGLMAINLAIALGIGWRLGGVLGIVMTLAYEPVAASIVLGQTSLITTLILWLGLAALLHAPVRAGATLGLLVIKPHLAWVAPLAVIGQGRWAVGWRAVTGALVVAGGWIAASLIWPGPAAWSAFLDGLGQAGQALARHQFPWQQMPTLFVSTAAAGAPTWLSAAAQACGALLAGALLLETWRARPGTGAVALSLIGAALASPYLYHYDLVCAGLGAALHLGRRPLWTARRGAIAYLALLIPLVSLVQNDLGAILGDNAWRIQPMGPMLLALFLLTWSDLRSATRTPACTA